MEINFDKLRERGAVAFNDLVEELNRHVHGEYIGNKKESRFGEGKDFGDTFCTGDIRDQINRLRDFISAVISLEIKDQLINSIDIDLAVFDEEGE